MSVALPPSNENTSRRACKMNEQPAEPLRNPWFEAINKGSLTDLCSLWQQGEDIHQFDEKGKQQSTKQLFLTHNLGQNALHRAAQYGYLEIVHFLIINGLDPNQPDQKGTKRFLRLILINIIFRWIKCFTLGGC